MPIAPKGIGLPPRWRWLFAFILAAALSPQASARRAVSCAFDPIPEINFGTISPFGGQDVRTSTIFSGSCQGQPDHSILVCVSFESGSGGASGGNRQAKNERGQTLNYQIYSDWHRTQPLGTGESSLKVGLDYPGPSTYFNRTIYGSLPRGQNTALVGAYSSSFDPTNLKIKFGYADPAAGTCARLSSQQTLSTTFRVSAIIDRACEISARDLNFGTLESLTSNHDAASTVRIQCTNGINYRVALDGGRTNATSPTTRQMSNGPDRITYGLYQDANRMRPWGNAADDTYAGSGTGVAQSISVYGRVFQQALPSAGDYADTVVVTLTY